MSRDEMINVGVVRAADVIVKDKIKSINNSIKNKVNALVAGMKKMASKTSSQSKVVASGRAQGKGKESSPVR